MKITDMNRDFYNRLSDGFKNKYPIIEQEEKYLYESLLYSYTVKSAVDHLNEGLQSTNETHFKQYDKENRYYLFIKNGEIGLKQMKWEISESAVYGWFPSKYSITGKFTKFTSIDDLMPELNKNIDVNVIFDAKYDIELFIDDFVGDYVYHISPRNKKEKILKFGLAPKSDNKMANYSSRIYLTYTMGGIDRLLTDPKFHPDSPEFVIFRIDVKELLRHRVVRFFEDPAYKDYGFYTYENIPPNYIEAEKEMKEVDSTIIDKIKENNMKKETKLTKKEKTTIKQHCSGCGGNELAMDKIVKKLVKQANPEVDSTIIDKMKKK